MAAQDNRFDVFKFVALRPPTPPSQDATQYNFTVDDRLASRTPVARFLAQFNQDNVATLPAKLKEFIGEQKYDLHFPQASGDLTLDVVAKAAADVPAATVSTASLTAAIEAATSKSLADLYAADAATSQRNAIWDNYYAFYVLSRYEGQDLGALTTNLRIYHLLNLLYRKRPVADAATLQGILNATPIIDKVFTTLPTPAMPAPAGTDTKLPAQTVTRYKNLWTDLANITHAIAEVRTVPLTASAQRITSRPRLSPVVDQAPERAPRAAAPATAAKPFATQTTLKTKIAVEPTAYKALSASTKSLLDAVLAQQDNFNRSDALTRLNDRLQTTMSNLSAIDDPRLMDYASDEVKLIPGVNVISNRLNQIVFQPFWPVIPANDNVRAEIRPLGIGDLKVVKQKLLSYQLGEVAHIENVLRGEYKERKYRTLDRTEQTLAVTTETIEETTKDTQTTERFELKKESENTIQEQMSVQAGVTVSGSYGMVTFGAHGDFAYSTSSQQSTKSSSNFAREVVDRSVTRIQKSVRQEQITKQLHEVEEIDTHGLDNKGQSDNLTGVYRWVDKYYEAQIYNYGKRMMFEFIIPEPAAFYGYAQTHQPKVAITPPMPLPAGLTHRDITELTYQTFIRDYQVQGCQPPPPYSKVVSATMSSDAKIDDGTPLSKSSKDLVVPQGYLCDLLAVSLSLVHAAFPQFRLSVGVDNYWYSLTTTGGSGREKIDWASGTTAAYDGIIPASVDMYDVNSYFVNIVASCVRMSETYELWQIQTFEKIMAAYQALKATYDQQVAAQQTQQGIAIHGQNPGINRKIEQMELKKASVKLLMDTWAFGAFAAMKQTGDNPPDFELHQAVREGQTVQFFEQAFEWENLTYLFYPYFWGRQSQWIAKITNYDEDPLFTQFLQAGSARVVVPVHPAYNDAVMYYLENNGAIWNGGEPPRLNDPMFISLADELRNLTDDLQGATPEGDPWQVILPTTLVYLQKDAALPIHP